MEIDWTTVVFEIANFAILVAILGRFVFRPVARTLDARAAEIRARAAETEAREAEAAAIRERYEAELRAIDDEAEARRAEARRAAREEADAIVSESRAAARAEMERAASDASEARGRALDRFRDEVFAVGAEAARRIVCEIGDRDVTLAFARRAVHAFADALGDGARSVGRVEVAHAPDADPDAIASAVRATLGAGVEIGLVPAPELVGGVRIRGGGHEVEASVGRSLDGWYRGLLGETAGGGAGR